MLADLSRVWVLASVPEAELGAVRPGSQARITASFAPRWARQARVVQVQPQSDPSHARSTCGSSSTMTPSCCGLACLSGGVPRARTARVAVPEEALVDRGFEQLVYVEREPGVFTPRRGLCGRAGRGLGGDPRGLRPGERVAASGVFLLDSESRMRSGAQ